MGGFFLVFIFHVDAPEFLKFISSSGTATERIEMQELDSLRWYTKYFASRPSFLIHPKLVAVRNRCQLTAVCWPAGRDLAGSSCWTDVCNVGSVSVAGMCFVFRAWKRRVGLPQLQLLQFR